MSRRDALEFRRAFWARLGDREPHWRDNVRSRA
jgi:hypothetical protein